MKHILYLFCLVSLSIGGQSKALNFKQILMIDTNPEQIVKSLIDAMAINDAKKIRSLFNSNASQAYGDGPPKSGKAFFSWLESDIIERKGHVENAKFSVKDNEVVVTGTYSSNGYTNKANFLFVVKEAQIISWRMRY